MLKTIGANCKRWRVDHGYFQQDVADDTLYSVENVCGFENGRNDNLRIVLWYMLHGMTLEELLEGVRGYGA